MQIEQRSNEYRIRLLPHLKKFVQKQLFDGQLQPYKIEEDSLMGKAIIKILMDKRAPVTLNRDYGELTQSIMVKLSQDMTDRAPRTGKLETINRDLHHLFKQCLFTWIKASNKLNVPTSEAIRSFRDHFELEEDEYGFENARKAWNRYRDSANKSRQIRHIKPSSMS